jgi:hypothetical protein
MLCSWCVAEEAAWQAHQLLCERLQRKAVTAKQQEHNMLCSWCVAEEAAWQAHQLLCERLQRKAVTAKQQEHNMLCSWCVAEGAAWQAHQLLCEGLQWQEGSSDANRQESEMTSWHGAAVEQADRQMQHSLEYAAAATQLTQQRF